MQCFCSRLGQPDEPGQAGQPGVPSQTGQPGQSGQPGQPGQPDQPGQPTGQPVQPEQPTGQPGQPDCNKPVNNQTFPGQIINNQCVKEGFVADENNCAKFYRCVANGQGGIIKYEYSCGTGTVWDQSIFSCNYPSAVSGKCYKASELVQPVGTYKSTQHYI